MIKMIAAEDLMVEMEDNHQVTNIDINFVTFTGNQQILPNGLSLLTMAKGKNIL